MIVLKVDNLWISAVFQILSLFSDLRLANYMIFFFTSYVLSCLFLSTCMSLPFFFRLLWLSIKRNYFSCYKLQPFHCSQSCFDIYIFLFLLILWLEPPLKKNCKKLQDSFLSGNSNFWSFYFYFSFIYSLIILSLGSYIFFYF